MIESGYELVTLHRDAPLPVRWWLYLHVEVARPQQPRKGVADYGFRFARGGLTTSREAALGAIALAREEAEREWRVWQHQPSHALARDGSLIPLGDVPLELGAS